jgi:hypothetical protein
MTRDGSAAAPFNDLKTALENPKLKAGHTIYLRAGTHILRGDTSITAPNVTIRPYAGEAAIIELDAADLSLNGAGLALRDVTIRSSVQQRTSAQVGSAQTDISVGAFDVRSFATLTNVRIAGSAGAGWWTGSAGTWKGVLVQDSGWDAPDRGHGHAFYSQNNSSDGTKALQACILVNGFSYSLHIYGSKNAFLSGYALADCIVMNDNALIGGEARSRVDAVMVDNCAFYAPFHIGYRLSTNGTASITDCLLRRLTIQQAWENLTVDGCTVLAGSSECVQMIATTDYSGLHVDNNVYISSAATPFNLVDGGGGLTFAQWQARTGLDAHSRHYATVQDAVTAGDLVVPIVRVFAVNEGKHKANIAIWNPNEDATVSVDLSALALANGNYELRQARDYTGDVRAVKYTGKPVSVVMSGTTAYPPGYPTPYHPDTVPANALPVFGAFELWAV